MIPARKPLGVDDVPPQKNSGLPRPFFFATAICPSIRAGKGGFCLGGLQKFGIDASEAFASPAAPGYGKRNSPPMSWPILFARVFRASSSPVRQADTPPSLYITPIPYVLQNARGLGKSHAIGGGLVLMAPMTTSGNHYGKLQVPTD